MWRHPSSVLKSLRLTAPLPAVAKRHPVACSAALLGGAFLLAWSAATTSYILFHDDALRLLANRASTAAQGYEERIAALQSEIDEERSRLAVERERNEATLAALRRRQATIEARHGLLSDLLKATTDEAPPARGQRSSSLTAPSSGPTDTVLLAASDLRQARLAPAEVPATSASAQTELAGLDVTLDRLEREQVGALAALEEGLERRERRIRTVLTDLGIAAPVRIGARPVQAAAGGPFVPLATGGDGFDARSGRARSILADLGRLQQTVDAVPLRRPVAGAVETTSGFGARLDPFLGRAAFHTGMDFRGDTGDPVRATAAGVVTAAGRDGGYGLMVEIDHGAGLTTRYAHLSAITVAQGDTVTAGAKVGRVGSTGRSTGPHLHYETRIKGEPVDPQRFLRAGLRIAAEG